MRKSAKGRKPAVDHANSDDDSPAHNETGHTLMQRGSDIQFLRRLARSNGKVCRIACAGQPGDRVPRTGGKPLWTTGSADRGD